MRKILSVFFLMAIASSYAFSANIIDPWATSMYDGDIVQSKYVEFEEGSLCFRMDPFTKTIKVKTTHGDKIGDDAVLALSHGDDIITYGELSGPDYNRWYTYHGDYDKFAELISHEYYYRFSVDYVLTSSSYKDSHEISVNYYYEEYDLMRRLEILEYKDVYGEKGPAGGYIILDKGSYSEGWRYIEAAPYDVRFYNGKYSCDGTDPLYKLAKTYISSDSRYQDMQFYQNLGDAKKLTYNNSNSFTEACKELEYNGYSDWLLPTFEEQYLIANNLFLKGKGNNSIDAYNFAGSGVIRPIRYF